MSINATISLRDIILRRSIRGRKLAIDKARSRIYPIEQLLYVREYEQYWGQNVQIDLFSRLLSLRVLPVRSDLMAIMEDWRVDS